LNKRRGAALGAASSALTDCGARWPALAGVSVTAFTRNRRSRSAKSTLSKPGGSSPKSWVGLTGFALKRNSKRFARTNSEATKGNWPESATAYTYRALAANPPEPSILTKGLTNMSCDDCGRTNVSVMHANGSWKCLSCLRKATGVEKDSAVGFDERETRDAEQSTENETKS